MRLRSVSVRLPRVAKLFAGVLLVAGLAVVPASPASAVPACVGGLAPALLSTVTCSVAGSYTVTVPTGTTSVVVDAVGAGGGAGYPARSHIGGNGGEVIGTATLPAGTAYLYVIVGAAGTGDNHGISSGGGASAIMALDSDSLLLAKLAIAGGGGGGAYNGDGGAAGSAGTSDNSQAVSGPGQPGLGPVGGAGGTGTYAVGTAGGNDSAGTATVASGGGGGVKPGGAHGGAGGGGYGGGGGGGASVSMLIMSNVAGGGGGSSLASSRLASASVSVKAGSGGVQLPGLVAGDGAAGSVALTFNGLATPGVPTGVSARPGDGQASVSFTAPVSDGGSPITGYTVTSSPGGRTATCATSPCVVTGLTNGTAYTFTVHATNANGNSGESSATTAVTPALVPGAPTGVSAARGDGQEMVSFTAPASNGGSAIISYTVTSSPGGRTATCGASPCVVTGLTNGTAYTFTVHATNAIGDSVESVRSAAVTAATTPDAPTAVSATPGDGQAHVSFTAPANDGGSPVTGYTVTVSPGGRTVSCAASPCTVTGLTNGTAYTFTVQANNVAGGSDDSGPTAAITPAQVPGAPTGVVATAGAGQASVSFTAPVSDGGSPIIGYTVTSSPGGLTATCSASPCVVTGLTNGTAYTFTVRASNAVGSSVASAVSAAVTPLSVPGAPTGVSAVPANGQASVSFTPPADTGGSPVTSYTVTSAPGGLTSTCATSPCVVTGLANGTLYTFTVTASNITGPSAPSAASAAVTPATMPGAPTAVVATRGAGQASVAFTAPISTGGSPIIGYTVTSAPGGLTATCPSSPCVVTALTNGTAYTFRVTATNAMGTSAPSTPSPSVTPATVPGAPTGVTATESANQASVAFTAPISTGGSPITGYTVTSAPGGLTATCATSPCVVTGLTNGTGYTFTVRASNAVGPSAASAPSPSVTPATVPGAPTGVTATESAGQASVAFTAPVDDGGSPVTSYTVTSAPDGLTATCVSSPCVVTGLTNGTAYTFSVAATNRVGGSDPSASSLPVIPVGAPDAPSSMTTSAGNAQVSVSFPAPADQGSAIVGYQISTDNGDTWVPLVSTETNGTISGTVGGLTNGTEYTVRVRAVNGVGAGTASTPVTVTPITVPDVPTEVSAALGNRSAEVSFTAPAETGGSPVTGYTVTSSPGGVTATCATSPCTITGLTNGTAYTFTVHATNDAGDSGESVASNEVVPAAVPSPPESVTGNPGDGSVDLLFVAPSDEGGSPITGYEYSIDDGTTWTTLNTTDTGRTVTGTVSGLANGTAYPIRVRAVNAAGGGTASDPITVTPRTVPGAPGHVSAVGGAGRAVVTFTEPDGDGGSPITGYTVTSAPGGITATCPGSPCTVTGLANGTAYTFTVHASNDAGDSAESAASAPVTPRSRPAALTGITATATPTSVTVTFAAPDDGGSPITGYQISTDNGRTWKTITITGTGATRHGTLDGLIPGSSYSLRLRAVNDQGTGGASQSVPVQTPLAALSAPTAVAGTSSVTVSWAKSPTPAVTGYTVQAHPGPATCTTTSIDATSCVIGGTAGVSYTYTVIAHTPDGDTPASAPSQAVIPAAATIPATAPLVADTTLTTTDGILATVNPAQQITFVGTGFLPLSSVSIILYSSPIVLATPVTSAEGTFIQPVTLPATITPGIHNFIASGVDTTGTTRYLRMQVTVAPPVQSTTITTGTTTAPLAYTGTPALQLLLWAFLLTGTGLLLQRKGRRHRHDQ